MQPRFTRDEVAELRRLLEVMKNESNLPGERRIAMAEFDRIYKRAVKRAQSETNRREYAY